MEYPAYFCNACGKKHHFRGPLCFQCNEALLFSRENKPRGEDHFWNTTSAPKTEKETAHG